MAKKDYVGINGVARKINARYVGVNNVARKVKKGYIGVGGVARLFFQAATTWKRYAVVTNYTYSLSKSSTESVNPGSSNISKTISNVAAIGSVTSTSTSTFSKYPAAFLNTSTGVVTLTGTGLSVGDKIQSQYADSANNNFETYQRGYVLLTTNKIMEINGWQGTDYYGEEYSRKPYVTITSYSGGTLKLSFYHGYLRGVSAKYSIIAHDVVSSVSSRTKGSYIDTVEAEDGTYPDNGIQGNYWYVKQ